MQYPTSDIKRCPCIFRIPRRASWGRKEAPPAVPPWKRKAGLHEISHKIPKVSLRTQASKLKFNPMFIGMQTLQVMNWACVGAIISSAKIEKGGRYEATF